MCFIHSFNFCFGQGVILIKSLHCTGLLRLQRFNCTWGSGSGGRSGGSGGRTGGLGGCGCGAVFCDFFFAILSANIDFSYLSVGCHSSLSVGCHKSEEWLLFFILLLLLLLLLLLSLLLILSSTLLLLLLLLILSSSLMLSSSLLFGTITLYKCLLITFFCFSNE